MPQPALFDRLIALLTDATVTYLSAQIEAGAETVMLFDTWAGILSPRAVPAPCHRADAGDRACAAAASSRGAGHRLSASGRPADRRICAATGVDGVGLDTSMDLGLAGRLMPTARRAAGQSRSVGTGRRRSGAAAGGRRCAGRAEGAAVRVQSRPWHRAADAARACRRVGGAGACGLGSPSSCSIWADRIDRRRSGRSWSICSAIPAILRVPFFVRPFLARRIAAARLAPARASYAMLGGSSPLLELTRAQAAALEAEHDGAGC